MDKIATLFSSIVVGCSHIKDINHKLTPYPLAARLSDTIYEVAEVLGSLERIGTVRADAIYGIGPDIALLIGHNLSFFVKGNSSSTAKRILSVKVK